MIENQNAGVTQKKKKYGRLKDFICFSVAAFISFSQVSPIWAAEGTRVFDEAGLFSAEEVQELETRIDEVRDSQDADLAVLTVEDAQGESAESYADDFTTPTDWASGTMRVVFCFRSIWTTGRYTFLPPGMR
ncbi:TPM domain-containing protein [Clostridium sp. AF29-8BH]|uniref:TPM domain-containing protein n=1 Tax=Clostridium sp. AF29-8BH TaxID=2293009 RepID=UPI000E49A549|nr:TPM domain-containing protein [Clostridium sp. AF37-7]RHP59493.1 TPM domain-containing protein [Clostridium sp. AF29-8BH]